MSIGENPMDFYFVFFHLVYVHPQISAGRFKWAISSRGIVIMIRILLGKKNKQTTNKTKYSLKQMFSRHV